MQVDSNSYSALTSMISANSVNGTQKSQNGMPPPPPPSGSEGGDDPLSSFISSIEEDEGTIIEDALSNLSGDGQTALKEALESYKSEGVNASDEEREEQFLTILNDIFTNYDEDTSATGILLSQYA